ncbi:hypothetical protein ACJIZ3_023626 [Penstemon smallii]|uniref:Uncharacterized protein n=1 Tax=Penstemon smallii TaxID=265156 RepID=A0ABD3TRY4_9LAMI
MSCFQGLFYCPEAFSLLLHNFCIYHISPPGHELGAAWTRVKIPAKMQKRIQDRLSEVFSFQLVNSR